MQYQIRVDSPQKVLLQALVTVGNNPAEGRRVFHEFVLR